LHLYHFLPPQAINIKWHWYMKISWMKTSSQFAITTWLSG